MITRTPMLHIALIHAAHHELVWFPGWLGGHLQGFGWRDGGDPPPEEQEALTFLDVVHLIGKIPARVCHEIGAEVFAAPVGMQVLSAWNLQAVQISPARSIGVHPLRAGDTTGGGV